jgi:phosphate/sulfate permease
MGSTFLAVVALILVALVTDFINGFDDAANSTVVLAHGGHDRAVTMRRLVGPP